MKAVICGAGIAGLALAQRLTTIGWEVVVVDRAPGPRDQGYMIDFFGLGYDAAEKMGLLARLKELGYMVEEVTYLDSAGRRTGGLNYARFAQIMDGRLLSIMRPHLEQALREQVADKIELRFDCTITAIDPSDHDVKVTLSDGAVLDADLLVGADGIHSSVRQMMYGDEKQFFRYLGFHTSAYLFDDDAVHAEVNDRFCLTDSVDRLVGLYGLRDGRVAAFTVHRTDDPTLPDDFQHAVQHEYASLGWIVPQVLTRCPRSEDIYYDQVAQVEVPRWSQGRITLVGDACGAVSLLAGQGASLAVAGAYLLGDLLATNDAVPVALSNYEKIWRPVVEEKQAVGRKGTEWFLPSSTARLWMRRAALKLSRLPGLDRLFGSALVGKSAASIDDLTRGVPA